MAKAIAEDAQACTVLWAGQRAGQGRAGQGRAGHTWEELPDDLVPGALDQVTTMQQPAGPNVI